MALIKDYPRLDFSEVRIILVEKQPFLLNEFPQVLQGNAQHELIKKHIELQLGQRVIEYDKENVVLDHGLHIPTRTLIWAAGGKACDLVQHLGVIPDRQQRIPVSTTLQIPGHPEIFVIGDAAFLREDDRLLPMMAPVAMQHGRQEAKNIEFAIKGHEPKVFLFKDPGSLATIGRNKAVARIGRINISGFAAWLVWVAVHIYGLIGFRNRILVLVNWIWDYFFFERAVRLITQRPKSIERK